MKPVLIKIESLQRNEEGEELKMELVSEGHFVVKNGTQYLVYEESELTDMKGVTTIIKIMKDGTVMLMRLGTIRQRQEYRKGKVSKATYTTEMGKLTLLIKTYECDVQLEDGIGTIRIGYELDIEGLQSNYMQLTITVQEDYANGNEEVIETRDC